MSGEFKNLMGEFRNIGKPFCTNVSKVVDDTEVRKVAEIYQAGLTAALSGTADLLVAYFDGLPTSQQQEIDRLIGASGGQQLLAAAANVMREDYLGNASALSNIPTIIEIVKKIIENFVKLPGGIGRLLEKIDLILDGIGKLLQKAPPESQPKPATGGQTVSPSARETLKVGQTKTLTRAKRIKKAEVVPLGDPTVGVSSGSARPHEVSITGSATGGPVTVRITYEDGTTEDIEVTVTD